MPVGTVLKPGQARAWGFWRCWHRGSCFAPWRVLCAAFLSVSLCSGRWRCSLAYPWRGWDVAGPEAGFGRDWPVRLDGLLLLPVGVRPAVLSPFLPCEVWPLSGDFFLVPAFIGIGKENRKGRSTTRSRGP